jgi:hypothetical protein
MNGAKRVAGLLLLSLLTGAFLFVAGRASLWIAALTVTVLHLLIALALVVLVVGFLRKHVRQEKGKGVLGFGKILQALLWLLIYVSGAWLLLVGRRGYAPTFHLVIGVGLICSLLAHAGAFRKQFALGGLARGLKVGLIFLLLGLVLSAKIASSDRKTRSDDGGLRTIRNAFLQVTGELPPYRAETMSPDSCARCHREIVSQWKQSLHAVADTEIIYARVVAEFREKHGIEASNWCAACHSPLRVARGQLNIKVADVEQPNVDCTICHSITEIHSPAGDNRFTLHLIPEKDYAAGLSQRVSERLLLLQPSAHQARWNAAMTKKPEFCGACHTQTAPPFMIEAGHAPVLQDTFGEWQRSKFNTADAALRKTCQDCHLPVENGARGIFGKKIPSHYFAGGSVDIARLSGARERLKLMTGLLANTASLSVEMQSCGAGEMQLLAKVLNYGAGHNLPTGVTDLREVWLEVTVTDEKGAVIYHSGGIDDAGHLDEAAVRFGVRLGDEERKPVRFHDIARARYIFEDTTIPSGATRETSYSIPLRGTSTAQVSVRLLYRTVPQDFINHYMTPDLRFQVVTMASASLTFAAARDCRAQS